MYIMKLFGEINIETNHEVTEKCATIMVEYWKDPVTHPILLHIDSEGGCCEATSYIKDTLLFLQRMGFALITFNTGRCFSAAADIYLLGDKRYALPSSRFLIHKAAMMGVEDVKHNDSELQRHSRELAALDRNTLKSLKDAGVKLPVNHKATFEIGRDVKLGVKEAMKINLVNCKGHPMDPKHYR